MVLLGFDKPLEPAKPREKIENLLGSESKTKLLDHMEPLVVQNTLPNQDDIEKPAACVLFNGSSKDWGKRSKKISKQGLHVKFGETSGVLDQLQETVTISERTQKLRTEVMTLQKKHPAAEAIQMATESGAAEQALARQAAAHQSSLPAASAASYIYDVSTNSPNLERSGRPSQTLLPRRPTPPGPAPLRAHGCENDSNGPYMGIWQDPKNVWGTG